MDVIVLENAKRDMISLGDDWHYITWAFLVEFIVCFHVGHVPTYMASMAMVQDAMSLDGLNNIHVAFAKGVVWCRRYSHWRPFMHTILKQTCAYPCQSILVTYIAFTTWVSLNDALQKSLQTNATLWGVRKGPWFSRTLALTFAIGPLRCKTTILPIHKGNLSGTPNVGSINDNSLESIWSMHAKYTMTSKDTDTNTKKTKNNIN